jgi:MoCo/4Fe-4S cofactor protein with predicted Tat translocation signal
MRPEKTYWQSLEEKEGRPGFWERRRAEFNAGDSELALSGASRREFLGLLGASAALAGVGLSGCIRKPREKILPFADRPENLVPGRPRSYATSAKIGGSVLGLLVTSHDGRPTKIEGNPLHPMSLGSANAWAQAAVLDLYDPHRSKTPLEGGKETPWERVHAWIATHFGGLRARQGEGLAVLIEDAPSPTLEALLADLLKEMPAARLYRHDATCPQQWIAGAALLSVEGFRPRYALDRAHVVVALDSDFLGTEGDVVRHARLFSERRRVVAEGDPMNRLYAVEPALTVTGIMADNRLRLAASQVEEFTAHLCAAVFALGVPTPAGAREVAALLARRSPSRHSRWVQAVARDLVAHQGKSLVLVGERQPARVQALGLLLNAALGNLGTTLELVVEPARPRAGTLEDLAAAMRERRVQTLILLGGNPVYDAPAELGFGALLERVETSVHLSAHLDETSRLVRWHLPRSHFLEAWGDWRASDGTLSLQQPLIAPLYATVSDLELLARILGRPDPSAYKLVRDRWAAGILPAAGFEAAWDRVLHDGLLRGSAAAPSQPALQFAGLAADLARPAPPPPAADRLELVFPVDPSVLDGRYAANPWLQELPDPVTKLTWDNALLIGPSTARRLGVRSGDQVELLAGGRRASAAVWVTPGMADNVLSLSLGYGREAGGAVAQGHGFNVNRIRPAGGAGWLAGVTLKKVGGRYKFASTQTHHTLTEPITGKRRYPVREATLAEYRADPGFAARHDLHPRHKVRTLLWRPPNRRDGPQWGMSIDLNACIGCNACTIACQAENNVPVVGKERVARGREMHWLRLDRYFSGEGDDVQVVFQPMACQQCETAPCESVCPVAATAHSDEGLNDMAYNRCIGTRYCSNNCPYKVRRFNFFNYNREADEMNPLLAMQRNPNVTVRFRGVMEKCTYCVQRLSMARIAAKREGHGVIPDQAVVPACAQTCPTQAIVFGDLNDPESAVSRARRQKRDYEVLGELNVKPRTTYLARLRNPNPELG